MILEAGHATLELTDPPHAAFIDEVEVGRRVAGHIRVAFEVDDSRATASKLAAAGATVIAEPTRHALELAQRTARGAGGPAAHALHRARHGRAGLMRGQARTRRA